MTLPIPLRRMNMSDLVTQSRCDLDELAGSIKSDLARRTNSRIEFAEATRDLCLHLVKARDKFAADQAFGKWFDSQGFDLDYQERAAAIALGRDMDRVWPVLQITDRRSLRTIRDKECRFDNVVKPPKTVNAKEDEVKEAAEDTRKAAEIIHRRRAAGEVLSNKAVAEEAGVPIQAVKLGFAYAQGQLAATAETLAAQLSQSAREKLDATIRAYQHQLDQSFEYRVREASAKWLDDVRIPLYEKRLDEIEDMFKWRPAVMSKTDYNTIMRCLHPDSKTSRTEEQLSAAFQAFTKYKAQLVDDHDERMKLTSGMPRTREELLARRARQHA